MPQAVSTLAGEKVSRDYLVELFETYFANNGFTVKINTDLIRDREYYLYDHDLITTYKHAIDKNFYSHSGSKETWDCDKKAEHYSYWFHRLVPGCPVVEVIGYFDKIGEETAHEFCIVPTKEGYYYNINKSSYDYTEFRVVRF